MNASPTSHLLTADHQSDRIAIRRGGRELLVQNARADHRPFIHPIVAPDGDGILTENAPPHHPWQHGLYVGLNDVDGVGFWTEGLIILISGMVLGFATGLGIAKMLVKVLTGVFDPAPEALAIPAVYLIVLVVAGCVSTVLAIVIAQRVSQSRAIEELRTI